MSALVDIAATLKELEKIRESAPPPAESLKTGIAEEKALKASLHCDKLQAEIDGIKQDIREREKYAHKSFRLVSRWITGVFVILLLQGGCSEKIEFSINGLRLNWVFKLSDNVLLAVVGGTTVSIVGIYLVVANYLFPKRKI